MPPREVPFSELAEVNPPRESKVPGLSPSDEVSFIPMADVSDSGEWMNRQTRRYGEVAVGYTAFAEDDVLFAKITPCMENGKGAHARYLVNGVGFGSTEFHVLRAHQGVAPRFLFHWAQSRGLRRAAEAAMMGSAGQQRVDSGFFSRFRVVQLDGTEQRRIAAILDTLDEAIRKTEQLIAKLKQVKQGLLHDLLTCGIDERGELRDPKRHPGQFKASPLGPIPRNWEAAPFRQYGATDRAYLKTGPFGSSLKQEHWVPEGVPVITIGSLGEGAFTESELLHVSEETSRGLAAYAVMPGDIVFSRVADVGRSVVVGEPQRGWLISSNLMWIALDRRRASPSFAQANISANPLVRAQIRRFVNSAGRDVANAAVLNSIILPWPSLGEQERIAMVHAAQEERLAREAAEAHKLRLLRRGLTDDLLAGRARVTSHETAA
jgi:type I restriction enzyme S subunit